VKFVEQGNVKDTERTKRTAHKHQVDKAQKKDDVAVEKLRMHEESVIGEIERAVKSENPSGTKNGR
jgi:hypothetical protein